MLEFVHHIAETSSGLLLLIFEAFSRASHYQAAYKTWWEITHEWQTLIAGTIAFIPASVAAAFVWRQLNDQRRQFSNLQEASALKARLRLSRNLSHISRHLDKCYDNLISEDFSYDRHALPENLLDDILDAAISAQSQNFPFFQLYVEKIQQYASLCGIHADAGNRETLIKCFCALAELDALTDRLYPFSRFENEEMHDSRVSPSEIKSRLEHNLRRGKDISGTNLSKLLSHNFFNA